MKPRSFSKPQPDDMSDEHTTMASRRSSNTKHTSGSSSSSEHRGMKTTIRMRQSPDLSAILEQTGSVSDNNSEGHSSTGENQKKTETTSKKHEDIEEQPIVEPCKQRPDNGKVQSKMGHQSKSSYSMHLNSSSSSRVNNLSPQALPPPTLQPGAFRIGNLESRINSFQSTATTEAPSTQTSTEPQLEVEARVVDDDEPSKAATFAIVAENDPLQQNYDALKLQHERARKSIFLGLLLLVVVAATITGAVVGTTKRSRSNTATTSDALSDSPSASPSYAVLDKAWIDLGFPETLNAASQNLMGTSPSFSSDGNIVAVGLPGAHAFSGSVRVYQLSADDGTWAQLGQEIIGGPFDVAGWSLQLSRDGKMLVAASIRYVLETDEPGYVQVYRFSSEENIWIPVGNNIIGDDSSDAFGRDVAISEDGSILVVGAFQGGRNGTGYTKAYRFTNSTNELNGGRWEQLGQTIRGSQFGDNLGNSVALAANGKILAIGAHQFHASTGKPGYIRILELLNDDSWVVLGDDVHGTLSSGEFGWDIGLSNDGTVVITGATSSVNRQKPGTVQVFEWQAQDRTWSQRGQNLIGDDAGDQFGYSLAISGDGLVAAVGGWDRSGFRMGYVRLFRYLVDEAKWIRVGDRIEQDPQETTFIDEFGIAVGLSEDGTTLAITSPFHDLPVEGLVDVGRMQVFRIGD